MRVGGRISKSKLKYNTIHPVIIHGHHAINKLLIHHEHHRLLHAGPTLVCSSISLRFHVINLRKTVRTIIRACVTCRRQSAKPLTQLQGQLPPEHVTPDSVFSRVGIDFAGPFNIKYGYVHIRTPASTSLAPAPQSCSCRSRGGHRSDLTSSASGSDATDPTRNLPSTLRDYSRDNLLSLIHHEFQSLLA